MKIYSNQQECYHLVLIPKSWIKALHQCLNFLSRFQRCRVYSSDVSFDTINFTLFYFLSGLETVQLPDGTIAYLAEEMLNPATDQSQNNQEVRLC